MFLGDDGSYAYYFLADVFPEVVVLDIDVLHVWSHLGEVRYFQSSCVVLEDLAMYFWCAYLRGFGVCLDFMQDVDNGDGIS